MSNFLLVLKGKFDMKMKKIVVKFLINYILSCTHFFKLKKALLKSCGLIVGENTKIVGPIYFGNSVSVTIGDNCWIGKNISFDGDGCVEIGNNVDIAPHVTISTGGHKIGTKNHRAGDGIVSKVSIGSGTWIGTKTLIINNSTIGNGVVIAAGSVVIKNSEDNVLLAGNPAIVKRRLEND